MTLFSEYPNLWLFSCFGFFIFSILFFAIIYYLLYRKFPLNYIFAAEIQTYRQELTKNAYLKELKQLNIEIKALEDLIGKDLNIYDFPEKEKKSEPIAFEEGFTYNLESQFAILTGPGVSQGVLPFYLNIYDESNQEIYFIGLGEKPFTMDNKELKLSKLINHRKKRLKILNNYFIALGTNDQKIWSFFDFLYLSIITQTTIGYGDILPNSTTVRAFVIFQIMIGYTILIVLLNYLFGK